MNRLEIEEQEARQVEFEERLLFAIMYGTVNEARAIIEKENKEGLKVDPEEQMKWTVWHCTDIEKYKLLKEAGYNFKDDTVCIIEFTRMGALVPEIAQFMIDNGAIVTWKAIQDCARRCDLDVLKIFIKAMEEYE